MKEREFAEKYAGKCVEFTRCGETYTGVVVGYGNTTAIIKPLVYAPYTWRLCDKDKKPYKDNFVVHVNESDRLTYVSLYFIQPINVTYNETT